MFTIKKKCYLSIYQAYCVTEKNNEIRFIIKSNYSCYRIEFFYFKCSKENFYNVFFLIKYSCIFSANHTQYYYWLRLG